MTNHKIDFLCHTRYSMIVYEWKMLKSITISYYCILNQQSLTEYHRKICVCVLGGRGRCACKALILQICYTLPSPLNRRVTVVESPHCCYVLVMLAKGPRLFQHFVMVFQGSIKKSGKLFKSSVRWWKCTKSARRMYYLMNWKKNEIHCLFHAFHW